AHSYRSSWWGRTSPVTIRSTTSSTTPTGRSTSRSSHQRARTTEGIGVAQVEAKQPSLLRRSLNRWPLAQYIARRLLTSVLLMIGVTLVTFTLTTLVPGNPIAAALGEGAASNPATVEAYVERHGLDK